MSQTNGRSLVYRVSARGSAGRIYVGTSFHKSDTRPLRNKTFRRRGLARAGGEPWPWQSDDSRRHVDARWASFDHRQSSRLVLLPDSVHPDLTALNPQQTRENLARLYPVFNKHHCPSLQS